MGEPAHIQGETSSFSPVNLGFQCAPGTSGLSSSQGLMSSQVHPESWVSLHDPRQKKKRTVFTTEQNQILQRKFDKHKYLTKDQCKELAQSFHVTEHQIKIWFKNKRARQNRKKLEKLPGNHDGKRDHVSCDRPARPSSVPLGKQGQASCDISAIPKGIGIPLASVCADSFYQKQSISTNSLPLTPSSMSLDSESISSLGERPSRVSSPPTFHPSMFPDPESIFFPDENNKSLACETLMFAQTGQSTGTGERIPDLSAACPSSEHPATARIPASVQPSYFCTASSAFSATDTSASGNPTKTPSVKTTKLTERVQDDTFIKDQQFLKELSNLEAAEVALSPPDVWDSFSLSDFF